MKKLTFLLVFISIFGYAQAPLTNSNIEQVLVDYLQNPAGSAYGSINGWDVSNVTDMEYLFYNKNTFNVPIGSWDVSNVTKMRGMFYKATAFNRDISSWNMSSVTDMSLMFRDASDFNQDIGDWDVSNVTDMYSMFDNASAFNQDIGSWDVSNVTDMDNIFNNAGLSTDNYDRLLNNWSELNLPQNLELGALGINYCNGADARQRLIDDFGWTITDGGLDCATAAVEDENLMTISIYPNPVNDKLYIQGLLNPTKISVYNVLGKEVLLVKNTNNINVAKLPSGVYIIRISDGVGQTNRKFIKN